MRAIQIRMLAELEIITVDHSVYRNQEGQKQMTRAVEILDMITAMAKEMRMDECRKLLNGNLDSIPLELAKTLSGNLVLEHILEDHSDWLKTIRRLLEMVETYFRSDPVQVLISGLESPADMNGADQMALRMIHGDRTSDEIDDVILKYYGIYQYTKKLGLSDLHDWTP